MVKNIQPEEDRTCPELDGGFCSCNTCWEMVQLQLDMLEGQRLLVEMENRHRKLISEKNLTHSLINKRMPPEILSTIFAFCLPTPRRLEYCLETQPLAESVEFFPVKLGHVCRHWRDIAWSAPGLWDQLFLVLHSRQSSERTSLIADLVQEWLDRSGGLPISLYIRMEKNHHPNQKRYNPNDHIVLETVKQYSQRWQDLYLRMWTPGISQLGLGVTQLPLLRTFKVWPIGEVTETSWWATQMKPSRVDFHPGGFAALTLEATSRFFRNIDWEYLDEVVVGSLPWDDYIQILKSASQMTTFTMDTGISRPDHFSGSDPIVHSKLQYFNVSGWRNKSIKIFISALSFPSLKELHYDVGRRCRPYRISQCHCPTIFFSRILDLKSLSVQLSLSLEGDRYIEILRRWPSLTELLLIDRDNFDIAYQPEPDMGTNQDHSQNPSSLLSMLAATCVSNAATPPSTPFLPALQTLGYKASVNDPPWNAILSTLGPLSDIKSPHRRPLNALNIQFGYSAELLGLPLVCQLWETKEAGIDITLRDGSWYRHCEDINVFTSVMDMHKLGPC